MSLSLLSLSLSLSRNKEAKGAGKLANFYSLKVQIELQGVALFTRTVIRYPAIFLAKVVVLRAIKP